MATRETVPVLELDKVFAGVEPEDTGASRVATVVAEFDSDKLVRIKRAAIKTRGAQAHARSYEIDLAAQHRFPEIKIVLSALWRVTPQLAAREVVVAESWGEKEAAVYSGRPHLENPEDIFDWYDEIAEKFAPDASISTEPDIYTPRGIEEIIRYGKFRGMGGK